MKIYLTSFVFLFALTTLSAQKAELTTLKKSASNPCYTAEQEAAIMSMLKANKAKLKDELSSMTRSGINFIWPIRQKEGFTNNAIVAISNFVDHNSGTGIQDYNCGSRTYDGHRGTDIGTWPFAWEMYDKEQAEIIAAAPGIIIGKDDGNFDMNCSCSGFWNGVYIEHSDGSEAWYGHMKNGSLTDKAVGDAVSAGDYLGVVASSGCSSGPHLHFEVRDAANNVIDPFFGSCNSTITSSCWANQVPYEEPTIHKLSTHTIAPQINGTCPGSEFPNYDNYLNAGQTAFFVAYYHEQINGSYTEFEIIDAANNVVGSWDHTSPASYPLSYWTFTYNIPSSVNPGVWTFKATFNGDVVQHHFQVSCPATITYDESFLFDDIIFGASQVLETSGPVEVFSPTNSVFQAGNYVQLNEGFEVHSFSNFEAKIGNCPN